MKSKQVSLCIALAAVILVSGCVQNDENSNAGNVAPATPETNPTALANCLTTIDGTKLPASLGGYSGTPVEVTEPFDWKGPDGVKVEMPAKGYMSIYTSGTKSITAGVLKIKNTKDYNTILSDMQKTDAQDVNGVIKKIDVKGATANVFDYSEQESELWFIAAGDNIWVQFAFSGTTLEESQNWVTAWTNTIC